MPPKKAPTRIRANRATIEKALAELNLNKPYYTCRVVGNRLEFALYGGGVAFWPPEAAPKPKPRAKPRAKAKEG